MKLELPSDEEMNQAYCLRDAQEDRLGHVAVAKATLASVCRQIEKYLGANFCSHWHREFGSGVYASQDVWDALLEALNEAQG